MAEIDSSRETLLSDAKPGMVLAEAVLDKAGTRLISPGVELTEKSIHALKQRGIQSITVQPSVTEDGHNEAQEQKLQRLDALFRNSLDGEANRLLLDSLRRYRKMP
ncbi:hypothetical protein [Herbaspirillum rhizosphaerae]|uniref:hypothetical protein n=1 Tax=Herbaspirillum rhizosphaerae TaxID=346179 RepID=UPI000A88B8DB|nr:hypothetical protein [Herbaspirillum rhizosphaerae]